jgi:hypothetical protein
MIPSSILRGVFYFAALFLMAKNPCAHATETAPTLQWDPNPELTIAGYNVYIGSSSRNYASVIDVGLQTSILLTNLTQGITSFFAVTAYDADRLESPFSDEVFYTLPVDGVATIVLPCTLDVSNNSKTVRIIGLPGQQCRIAASSDLRQWEQVYFATLTINGLLEYTDTAAADKPMRFYRAIVTLP